MGVDSDVIARDQVTVEETIVAPRVMFADADNNKAVVVGQDVFFWLKFDGVSALGLAVVMPLHLRLYGRQAPAHRARQVDALPKISDQFSFENRGVTQTFFPACGVVDQRWLIGPTD